MYYFYRKSNQGHGFCPLYGGCLPFGESVIRDFTVVAWSYYCYSISKHAGVGYLEHLLSTS